MRRAALRSVVSAIAIASVACSAAPPRTSAGADASTGRGTIKGYVRVAGVPAQNPSIRMRSDPMCEQISGKTAVQESVLTGTNGSLANVFVNLQGAFPETPVPTDAVLIDQRGCIYGPRVVGVRAGQLLRVRNSDPGLHNVHGVLSGTDGFNVAQPMAGMVNEFRLKDPGILRLQCDVHGWMVAFVGVVPHPYFAVTGADGSFELGAVPVGTYSIQAWHELYGQQTLSVTVQPNTVTNVDFTYQAPAER